MAVNNSRAIYLEMSQQELVEDTQETFKHYLLSCQTSCWSNKSFNKKTGVEEKLFQGLNSLKGKERQLMTQF